MDFHGTAWLAWFWKPRNKEIRRLCLQQSFDLECTLCSGWTASQLLFVFFLLSGLFFLLLQKANQKATTKINVKFDHCYVTDRLHQVCLLFPDWPMNGELVSVRLYSMWDEEASRISVVFTDEAFVEALVGHVSR